MSDSKKIFLTIFIFLALNVFVWQQILFHKPNKDTELYFFDVGQGDSQMVILPNNVKILIDGGPNDRVLGQLSSILSPFDRYIDLVVMSHPQTDHFAGLIGVLKRYKVGAFVFSGKKGLVKSFNDLEKAIKENQATVVVLGEGDKIKYLENKFDILSPSKNLLQSNEPNDWTLVMKMVSGGVKALFTGDIDSLVENSLIGKYYLGVDILKVAHHGSRFSSGKEFLAATAPKIAVIEVGKNSYGHPTKDALERLAFAGAQIFRTDKDGTVKLIINNRQINIFKTRPAEQ